MKAVKDVSIYIISTFVANLLSLFMLPYLSRKLGVNGYGEMSYYQSYLYLLGIIIGISQQDAIQRYFFRYGSRNIGNVLQVGYGLTLLMGGLGFMLAIAYKSIIFAYITLSVTLQSLISSRQVLFQCNKDAKKYAISSLITSFSIVIVTVALFELINDNLVAIRFLAFLIANFISFTLISLFFKQKNFIRTKINKYKIIRIAKYLVIFSMPILLHNLSWFARGQVDKIFIFHKYSLFELGIYSMGLNLASIINWYISATNKAIQPHFFDKLSNNAISKSEVNKIILLILSLVIFLSLIATLLPEKIFLWLIGDKFQGVKYFFNLFLFDALLSLPYLFLSNALYFYGENKFINLISIITTIFYIIILLILLNLGIKFLPYASICTSGLKIIFLYFVLITRIKHRKMV